MSGPPRLSIHVGDYLKDTPPISRVNWEHHGIYLLALMIAWTTPKCQLPNDAEWLSRRFGCTVDEYAEHVEPVLKMYFKNDGNFYRQKRLRQEHDYSRKQSRLQSERAKARKRNDKNASRGSSAAKPETQSGNAPLAPAPAHSLSNEREKESIERFDEFWKAYPSRGEHSNPKKTARQKFETAVKHGADPEEIIRGAKAYAATIQRNGTEPKFIAQAVTWLNQERWKDQASLELDKPGSVAARLGVTPLGVGG